MRLLLRRLSVVALWSSTSSRVASSGPEQTVIYFNDFNGPLGASYPEWTSTGYSNLANVAGTVAGGKGRQGSHERRIAESA